MKIVNLNQNQSVKMEQLFENDQIDISTLPKMEDVEWIPLNKKYLPISLLGTWIFGFILTGIFLGVNLFNSSLIENKIVMWSIVGAFIFLFSLISTISFFGFKHKAYALREHDILYKSGLIFRKIIALPFNRIQHSEINQGPIERNFDLANLNVFTAGGHNSDMSIPGLLHDDAQNIKTFIMEKSSKHE